MMDVREAILERLVEIAAAIPGVKAAYRNEIAPPESNTPAILVLDADEKGIENDPEGRGPMAPRRMVMTPQLLIMLPQASKTVGTSLNGFRAALIHAIATDEALTALTTNGNGARLARTETSLAWGRSMFGEMGVSFAIPYVLDPAALKPATP